MFNESGRAYPKTDDVSATTNASRARANNHAATDCTPFAEGGFHTLNTLITSQELLYSRRNPFLATMFGIAKTTNTASPMYFRMYGGKYYWMQPDGVESLTGG